MVPLLIKVGMDGLNKRNIYRFIFLNGKSGGMNWEVSRYQFYYMARYTSQRGFLFDMGRNGKLRIVQMREGAQRAAGTGNASSSRGGGSGGLGGGSAGPGGSEGSRRDNGGRAAGERYNCRGNMRHLIQVPLLPSLLIISSKNYIWLFA
jgi:hypothetical protein